LPALLLTWISLTFLGQFESTAILAEIRKLVLAALVALLVVRLDKARVPKNLMSTIGRAAYSIYALHAPVAVALLVWRLNWWMTCVLAIASGSLVYAVFERPFDLFGHRLAAGRAIAKSPKPCQVPPVI
jgi:peptidoglycan/LPS O-acetylase OafA/YrhL